jgi:hypothetical protein
MRLSVCLFLWIASLSANARTFEERIELAKAAEQNVDTWFYEKVMFDAVGAHLATTMRACFAQSTNPQTDPFVLVADLSPEGKAMNVEVRPPTEVAVCFSEGFATTAFPLPPKFQGQANLPVVIEMRMKE